MPFYHPCTDEHGKPILLKNPSSPTPLPSWGQGDAVATVTPGGNLPAELNGIPFGAWHDAPTTAEGWNKVYGQLNFDEPPFEPPKGKMPAAGVAIQESDGRIWLVSPSNGFAGYTTTLPKGRAEGKVSQQASAIREAFEETGLQVEITGFLADSERSQTYTRYYLARRVGGSPAFMGWESQAVHLVPRSALVDFLTHPNDLPLLKAIHGLQVVDAQDRYFRKEGLRKTQSDLATVNLKQILLLELGAEGGALRLFLEPNELGIFSYRLEINSSESSLFNGEDFLESQPKVTESCRCGSSALVIDWAGALRLLDNTGWAWPLFSPAFVHPTIFYSVMNALKDRYSRFPKIRFDEWERQYGWGGREDAFDEDAKL